MNKSVKLVLRSVLFVLILAVLMVVASLIAYFRYGVNQYKAQDIVAQQISDVPENTLDVLFIGDSEAYCSFSPMCMWEKSGFTSYVCGTASQYIFDSYEYIKTALQTQKPKLILLETNTIYRKVDLNTYINVKLGQKIPVMKYHNQWKSFYKHLDVDKAAKNAKGAFEGYILDFGIKKGNPEEYALIGQEMQKISDLNMDTLRDIKQLCEEHNAKLIMVSSPSLKNWSYGKHKGLEACSKETGIDYIDLNMGENKVDINWDKDTQDMGDHLNTIGATKASEYLGKYLSAKYELQDHRKDSSYKSWNKKLKAYNKKLAKRKSKMQTNQ